MNSLNKDELLQKVANALNNIRPYLQADGGDIKLEEVTDEMVVKVKLLGACGHCPFSIQTLKSGVERALKKEVPEIKEVVSV